jgi:hypothetical protein
MGRRPLSVTIIAWFLIVTSIISVFTFWSAFYTPMAEQILAQSPLPRSVHMGMTIFSLVLNLLIGVALLKRQNWARYLYVGFGLFGIAFGLVTSPVKSILFLSVIFLAVIAFFLFRRPANEWFRGAQA